MRIGAGKLKVRGKGGGLLSLGGSPQGSVTVRLALGTRFELCATAPAKAPALSHDTAARFVGARNTPPPTTCAVVGHWLGRGALAGAGSP